MIEKIKRIIRYVTHDIWVKKESDYKSPRIRWMVRQAKVILYTVRGLGEHDILTRAAALTFYTVMAIVPVAAFLFAVTRGFGLEERLSSYLYEEFSEYGPLVDRILEFANAMLQHAKRGIIAAVSVLVLFWAIIRVFANVEDALNNIWEVRKARNLARKFTDYLAVVIVTPVMLIASNSMLLQLKNQFINVNLSGIGEVLVGILSVVIIWLLFTFLYKIMPHTKVKFKNAFMAGVVAGTFFQLFQMIYVYIQSEVSAYNVIYGSFAAIPLFLIWLQISWQIVLLGAELSFSFQNIKNYELEKLAEQMSRDFRKKVSVVTMQVIVRHFTENDGAVSDEEIAEELDLPIRIVRDAIFDLEKAGLVLAISSRDDKAHYYIPEEDIHELTVYDVISKVERSGKDHLGLEESSGLREIDNIMGKFDMLASASDANELLIDLNREQELKTAPRNGKP